MAPGTPAPPTPSFPDSLLHDLLEVSLTGVNVLRPVYDPAGEIEDFAIEYLNPAGQRMTGLAAQPGGTLLTRFPSAIANGILAYYRRAYTDGDTGLHKVNYQADGLDNYFRLAARRSGEQLVVSFTDTADQNRSAVEQALRESQAAEQAARAETETQRQRLYHILENFPAVVASYRGPEHVFDLVSHRFQRDFPTRTIKGLPVRQALPELEGQQYYEILDGVYHTGEPFYGTELETRVDLTDTGQLELQYYNVCFQATRDAEGRIDGILNFAYDVTDAVLARQQLEQLNQELETRVQGRTQEALALQAEVLATAQRQAEERARVFQIFEQTPACIALLRGPEHCFEYVNQAYQELFPGRELVGHPLAKVLPDAAEQGFLALLDGVYRTGETYFGSEVPLAIAQPNGRPPRQAYFTFTYQAYYEQDRVAGVSIFAFDVAEQVLARQQREAERQQLHDLFRGAAAPIVILDGPDLVFQLVNPAYQRIFPGRELLGQALLEALPELAGTPILNELRAVYDTGEPLIVQERLVPLARHAGAPLEDLYFTFHYRARRNAAGDVDGVLCIGHEVTDQVLARQVVEARETSFRQLADHVPGTLWVTNPAGECTYLSARWYATTGQTQTEGLGLGWTNAVHPDDAADAGTAFMAASTRHEPFSYLFRLRQRDGEYRWVTDQGLPRFGPTGGFEGMVGSVVDVHEQKLAELALQGLSTELRTSRDEAQAISAKLAASNDQLTRTNVDLDNFIYTASHDLKAPISNIEGLLYLLQEELPPAVAQDAAIGPTLTLMLDAVERFKRTIDHLTEVSKLQKENEPATALVNLATIVEDVRRDVLPQLEAAGAKLFVDVSALPPVQFSEKNLRSVVYNLLSNAVKYCSPDRTPRVEVSGHVRPGHTVLEVHDNGLGIAAEHLPRLFTMFQRFHDHVEGTGIGLYMVKRMVENAGGRIEVHSQLGAGTTFLVFLPHADSRSAQPFPAYVPA